MTPLLTEETAQKLLTVILSMQADVAILKAGLNELNHRLLGNGQPGEIATMKEDIDDLQIWRARHEGWSAGISAAIGLIASSAYEWITHRGMR